MITPLVAGCVPPLEGSGTVDSETLEGGDLWGDLGEQVQKVSVMFSGSCLQEKRLFIRNSKRAARRRKSGSRG